MTTENVRGPAMIDVARLAGVSHQTVSRVLNNHPNVRQETARRVRAAIAELGYRPNRAARALVTGRSQLLGVVALNTTLFGPASLLTAFEGAAAAAGFAVSVGSVANLDRESISAVVERHLDQRVAGIVVIAPVASADEALDELPTDVPLVTIDGDPTRDRPGVTVDQVAGARRPPAPARRGHRTVWHVSGPPEWFDGARPHAGLGGDPARGGRRGAAGAAGRLVGRVRLPRGADARPDPGGHRGLRGQRPPGARHPARAARAGRRVPEDLSVVGFDDVPEAGYFIPPLTTVRPDFHAVARHALELLLAQIEAEPPPAAPVMLAPALIERRSVAPPPADGVVCSASIWHAATPRRRPAAGPRPTRRPPAPTPPRRAASSRSLWRRTGTFAP